MLVPRLGLRVAFLPTRVCLVRILLRERSLCAFLYVLRPCYTLDCPAPTYSSVTTVSHLSA